MNRMGITLARGLLAAWCGAAALYVTTSIREQVSPKFNIAIKDELALIRFPSYYLFGFAMVSLGLVGVVLGKHPAISKTKRQWSIALLIAALTLMVADYQLIYSPLVELLNPVGQERAGEFLQQFTKYHSGSKYINFASLSLVLGASVLINMPGRIADD